jgi:endo-1,4-beta-D-glucanase Y
VSEGIGYGMIIAVYMDDQALFDDLWRYELAHTWTYRATPPATGTAPTLLMNWYILSDGNVSTAATGGQDGNGAATDADEDMAWALVMADRQWGGQGALSKSYLDTAKQMLGDIWKYEINNNRLPKNGSSWGDDTSLNISYFAPAYYRVFSTVSGEARWGKDVVDYIYTVIGNNLNATNGNQSNGLVPAFSQANGTQAAVGRGQSPLAFTYQYDSCRTPFRIGLDACWSADARAVSYVGKTSQFFSGIGASKIVDGYQLNGTANAQYPSTYGGLSAAFIGPAGVGAMHAGTYQSFVNDVYGLVRKNNMWCGGQYYDESWTMMSLLMLTGNFLDYTQY